MDDKLVRDLTAEFKAFQRLKVLERADARKAQEVQQEEAENGSSSSADEEEPQIRHVMYTLPRVYEAHGIKDHVDSSVYDETLNVSSVDDEWLRNPKGEYCEAIDVELFDGGEGGGGATALLRSAFSEQDIARAITDAVDAKAVMQMKPDDVVVAVGGTGGAAGACRKNIRIFKPNVEPGLIIRMRVCVGRGGHAASSALDDTPFSFAGTPFSDSRHIDLGGSRGGQSSITITVDGHRPIVVTTDTPTRSLADEMPITYIMLDQEGLVTVDQGESATRNKGGMAIATLGGTHAYSAGTPPNREYGHCIHHASSLGYAAPLTRHSAKACWEGKDGAPIDASELTRHAMCDVMAYGGAGAWASEHFMCHEGTAYYPYGQGGDGGAVAFTAQECAPLRAQNGYDGCVFIEDACI